MGFLEIFLHVHLNNVVYIRCEGALTQWERKSESHTLSEPISVTNPYT